MSDNNRSQVEGRHSKSRSNQAPVSQRPYPVHFSSLEGSILNSPRRQTNSTRLTVRSGAFYLQTFGCQSRLHDIVL